jgi:lipid-A-disaccharide synthase-like uncharacterized protein
MHNWLTPERIWLAVGFAGQALFASRFVIQWFKSEMEGRSVIPVAFWYCSIGGGVVLLAYAIYKKDPVFIIGQASGLLVYGRNLYLIFRERNLLRAASAPLERGSGV